jgi:hypothetical protein
MPIRRRQKASDVFANTKWAFRSTGTFEQAFPNIADCRIEVIFEGQSPLGGPDVRIYTRANASEYVDCKNPLCYNGGFNLGDLLGRAESERRTEIDEWMFCQGYEGSPKGRRNYGPCGASVKVKGTITYRANAEPHTR